VEGLPFALLGGPDQLTLVHGSSRSTAVRTRRRPRRLRTGNMGTGPGGQERRASPKGRRRVSRRRASATGNAGRRPWLARLPVEGVLAVPAAVLLHLDALTVV